MIWPAPLVAELTISQPLMPAALDFEVHVVHRAGLEAEIGPALLDDGGRLGARHPVPAGACDAANDECERDAHSNQKSTHASPDTRARGSCLVPSTSAQAGHYQ